MLSSCSTGKGADENLLESKGPEYVIPPEFCTTPVYNPDEPSEQTDFPERTSHTIDVKTIYQKPELPTGCEITSLAMVLNYLGYDVTKTELAEDYLEKNYSGKIGFDVAFMGDPTWEDGYGCYAPVIVKAAQNYLNDNKKAYSAWNVSGAEFETLYEYIDKDIPVIVWASMGLMDVKKRFCFYDSNGREIYWYDNEHCMVLCGYDKSDNTVIAADPLAGLMKYNADRFKYIYESLEKQAVIIF
jgi:uncharacterized protein YvpB